MAVNFGSNDTLTCIRCKNRMDLSRRGPDPKLGLDFELQTFTCSVCRHEIMRNTNRLGEVIADEFVSVNVV
jgi:hypothetical protein